MVRHLFVLCCMLFLPALNLNAQVLYGSVVGNAMDASNAPVPGAVVPITSRETSQSGEAVTNESGS
ncbi:MAG TPA: carboxypeptidase-like regulatory domain-containing protein [Bryobacteraceae bacterium]|nr:carboxypeptidase-like regulatory domain-containing protein [Bryobacteraceae bacterium]